MKNLTNYIQEGLKVNSKSKFGKGYNYHPKTKSELRTLIRQLMKERGNEANLNDIDTSEITNFDNLMNIGSTRNFNGDISYWNVSNVESMQNMFVSSKFNQDISNWNVSKLKYKASIFAHSPLEKNPPKWYK